MEFELDEQQLATRTMVRKFAQEYIKPITAEIDRILDVRENFPWEMFKIGSKLGLRTLALPEEYGGVDADLVTKIMVAQELGYADVSCAKIFAQCWKTSRLLYDVATQEQRERFLTQYRDDDTYLISQAMTEPECGSDNFLPYDGPEGGMKLSVKKKGNGYVLNGMKHFIANANVAKLFIIAARTDRSVGVKQGSSFFLVPKDTPGFSVGAVHDKVGFRAYGQAELILEDAYVPQENLLGGKENFDAVGYVETNWTNLGMGVHALTTMESAYNAALEYAKTRVQGGKPIIEHQAIAGMIADMHISIQAAQGLIRNVVRSENRQEYDRRQGIVCKVFNTEAAVKLTTKAMEVFGGFGVMKELPMEKYVRDSLVFLHMDGTNQVNRQRLCNLLKA